VLSDSMPMLTYEGSDSPAARLDARMKLLTAFVAVCGILIIHDWRQFAMIAALVIILVLGARIPARTVWSNLKPVLLFIVIGGSLVALETPGKGWSGGFVHASRMGLILAGRLSLQLMLLLLVTTVVTYTTSPLSIANALRRLFGFLRLVRVPVEDMTTMLTLAITFIPLMTQEVDRHLTARAARGANPRRFGIWTVLSDMLLPLMLANLQRGEELALALDTRLYGYGPRTHRTDELAAGTASVALVLLALVWVAATVALL